MRALVVDDSRPARLYAGRMLAELGFEVHEAANGAAALEALACLDGVEIVLLDWTMPEMDGITFLRALRRGTVHANLPVVMVTSHAGLSDIRTALETGAHDYLIKPFAAPDLRSKLETCGFEFAGETS